MNFDILNAKILSSFFDVMESKVFENLIKQRAGIASTSEFLLDLLDLLNNLPPFLKGGGIL